MVGKRSVTGETPGDPLDRLVEMLAGKAMRLAERIDAEIEKVAAELGEDIRVQSLPPN